MCVIDLARGLQVDDKLSAVIPMFECGNKNDKRNEREPLEKSQAVFGPRLVPSHAWVE